LPDFRNAAPGKGLVHIVGAGPGDADLLTLRALRVLRQADVVIHDRLIGPEILDFARPDAERIYVGKAKAHHSRPQAEINALMAFHAAQGRRVVRLKGGDPFVFGRGGEEMEYLLSRGIRVEIVPGITAALGCAAFAGIPLTHRDHATAVTFISGHAKDGEPDLDWAGLAAGRQTLVVYMGLSTAGDIARRLIGHGMAPSTPAAVIENGTLPSQKTVAGTLARLEYLIADNAIAGPALIVIGDVVRATAANCVPAFAAAE
jgi:uroporphyrin-III C-methyltransferase/precorrin-2 dehydrogenase/sirohydrochlorin ferrochelatase